MLLNTTPVTKSTLSRSRAAPTLVTGDIGFAFVIDNKGFDGNAAELAVEMFHTGEPAVAQLGAVGGAGAGKGGDEGDLYSRGDARGLGAGEPGRYRRRRRGSEQSASLDHMQTPVAEIDVSGRCPIPQPALKKRPLPRAE